MVASLDVALVAAVLALGIPIGGKRLFASWAGERVQGLGCPVDQKQVSVPPLLAAGLATEDPCLPFLNLDELLATLLAGAFLGWDNSRKDALPCCPYAVGFHRPLGQGKGGCDAFVVPAQLPHLLDLSLLGLSHGKPP